MHSGTRSGTRSVRSGRLVVATRILAPYRTPFYRALVERGIPSGIVVAGRGRADVSTAALRSLPEEVPARLCTSGFFLRRDVLRACAEFAPGILVVEHGARLDFAWSLLGMPSLRGVPRVIWTHGIETRERATGRPTPASLARRAQIELAAGLVCYDSQMAELLRERWPHKVVGVAPNSTDGTPIQQACGLDPAETRAEARRRLGLEREFYLVVLGRLIKGKQPTRALDVLERVRRVIPDTGLLFIGDGPERTSVLRRVGAMGYSVGRDVVLTGEIWDPSALGSWLHCGDVHLNTGYAGLNVVDALFAGLPTVLAPVTRRGPFHSPEWNYLRGHEGGLFAVDDGAEALSNRAVEYLSSSHAARRRVEGLCTRFATSYLGVGNMVDGFVAVAGALGCHWPSLSEGVSDGSGLGVESSSQVGIA